MKNNYAFKKPLAVVATLLTACSLHAQILFDNGPIVNSIGTGAAGADESMLYTTTFGMGTIGFGHQSALFNRVADDFVNPNCTWVIDSIVFFGYQTGSTTGTSTFTGVNLRIWDGIPDASNVVYGDTTTNRMIRSVWTGAYRVTETTHGNATRPIMRNVCATPGLTLPAGTFWIDWASTGSLASGPWAQARTPMNQAITGNGRQRIGSVWNDALDGGTGTPAQGLPFIVYGHIVEPIAHAGLDLAYCEGDSSAIGASPAGSGGNGTLMYSWLPSASLSNAMLANPAAAPAVTTSYVLTVTDSLGCVAMDSMMFTVNSLSRDTLAPSVCDSYTSPEGNVYTATGLYTDTLTNAVGCDSLITINLTVNASSATTITAVSCFSYVSPAGNTYTSSGMYVDSLMTANGCDSIITINLTIDTVNVGVTMSGVVLTADAVGASYQWVYCDSGFAAVAGETNQSFFPLMDGNYAVIVTENSCTDTSACTMVIGTGVHSASSMNVELLPNPSEGTVTLNFGTVKNEVNVIVTDVKGRTVYTASANGVSRLDMNASLEAGLYFVTIYADGNSTVKQLIRK